MDEEEVVALQKLENNNNNCKKNAALIAKITVTTKVKDMKDTLATQNIFKVVANTVLTKRLKQAFANGMATVSNTTSTAVDNMDDDAFETLAHWLILSPDDNVLAKNDLNNSNGYQFHIPIASGAIKRRLWYTH